MNSLVTIVCNESEWNPNKSIPLIERAAANPSCHELIIVDTSRHPIPECEQIALVNKKVRHEWTRGYNIYYAGALNLSSELASGDNLVYFSSKRGRIFDDRWIDVITSPLKYDYCGMAGHMVADGTACVFITENLNGTLPIHIQGGIFAVRRDVLRQVQYSHRFPHEYSDVWISWKLQTLGYKLFDVPEIMSIPIGIVDKPSRYYFVMDYS